MITLWNWLLPDDLDQMARKKNRLVCLCNGVTETEILSVLKKGAKDVDEVSKFTLASTNCGKCRGEIASIANHFLLNKKPDLQRNIEF